MAKPTLSKRTAWTVKNIAKYTHIGDKFSKLGTAKEGDEYNQETWELLMISAVIDLLEAQGKVVVEKDKGDK
tara:strand:+ start:1594 stop:1809 length:216 start_codon:yes stop_codon:yes gene_type:complete